MKYLLAGALLCLFGSIVFAAVSPEDVIRLTKAKTSDELILKLLQEEGLSRPVKTSDVVTLKEEGVSDRVIEYMRKLSHPAKNSVPRQTGESVLVSENVRAFDATTKDGKKVRMYTNLDQNGKRMGPPAPPEAQPADLQSFEPRYESQPQEIRVVVEPPGYEQPEEYYVQDQYSSPYFDSGYYPGYAPYYPYNSYSPYYPNGKFRNHYPGKKSWHVNPHRVLQRHSSFKHSTRHFQRPSSSASGRSQSLSGNRTFRR